jgi:hypothetical protein
MIHGHPNTLYIDADNVLCVDVEALGVSLEPTGQGYWLFDFMDFKRDAFPFLNAEPGWIDFNHL